MTKLSKRERRVVRLGGLVVGGILLLGRVAPAVEGWNDEVVQKASILRSERVAAMRRIEALPETLESLEIRRQEFVALAPTFLAAGGPAAASSALTSWIGRTGAYAGVKVGTVRASVDSTVVSLFLRVAGSVDLEGDATGVLRFIADVENGPELIGIQQLIVEQLTPSVADDQPEILRAHLVLSALVLHRPEELQ